MLQKRSRASLSERCLRSCSTRTVLASKENKMEDPKCIPASGRVKRRARSEGSRQSDKAIDSQTPALTSLKAIKVLGEIKNSSKIIHIGKRTTRTALKIYDYCETDPDTENRPARMSRKKSQMEVMAVDKNERVGHLKCKKSMQMSSTLPSKRKSVINSSYFLCGEKISRGVKRQSNCSATKILKTESKLKERSVLLDVLGAMSKISVESKVGKCAEAMTKNVEGKCLPSSGNCFGESNAKLACSDLTNKRNLNTNVVPKQSCSTPIISKMRAPSLGFSPIVAKTMIKSVSSGCRDSADKICNDVSDAFINVSTTNKQQEELDCSIESTESEELQEEVHHEPLHLGLTSTPEKSPNSAAPYEHRSFMDSGMDDVVEVTLYDSPKKLSPIKMVDSPDSSRSDDSCYWDEDFESPPQRVDKGTPVKNDVEEKVRKSFKAYHTPHQFRRHLFKKKSKKISQKPKSKSPAEVKLDLWASVMNNHFEDIEGSELVIE